MTNETLNELNQMGHKEAFIKRAVFIASLHARAKDYINVNFKKLSECKNKADKLTRQEPKWDRMILSAIEIESINIATKNNLDLVHDWERISLMILASTN